jgi:hypothetical protein
VALSVANAQAILAALLRGQTFTGSAALFLSIHTGDPGTTGANQYTGYTGTRPSITFLETGALAVSTNQQDFPGMGATTITHYGLWSATSGGTFQFGRPLDAPRTTDATGQTLRFLAGGVQVPVSS